MRRQRRVGLQEGEAGREAGSGGWKGRKRGKQVGEAWEGREAARQAGETGSGRRERRQAGEARNDAERRGREGYKDREGRQERVWQQRGEEEKGGRGRWGEGGGGKLNGNISSYRYIKCKELVSGHETSGL